MFKHLLLPILAAVPTSAVAAPAAYAMSVANGVMLNGSILKGSDPIGEAAFHAARLTLPDGTTLTFH